MDDKKHVPGGMDLNAESERNLEEIRKKLEVYNISALSKRIGLSRPTLYWVMAGNTDRITLKTYNKLVAYFGLE